MPEMIINYQALQNAEQGCNQTAKIMQNEFEQLKSQMQNLTASWTGEAMQMWEQQQHQWDVALQDLQQVLAQIGTALPQIAEGYANTDKAVGNMFGG